MRVDLNTSQGRGTTGLGQSPLTADWAAQTSLPGPGSFNLPAGFVGHHEIKTNQVPSDVNS